MAAQELQSIDFVDTDRQSDFPVTRSLCDRNTSNMDPVEVEDEDGDIDLNPFLRGSPAEASSSLSSEVQGSDHDGVDISDDPAVDKSQQIDEGMTRKRVILGQEEAATRKFKKRRNAGSEKDFSPEKENGLDSEVGDATAKEDRRVDAVALDEEDAICKRTRARYSLASFTLDELETFLQESDGDDDLPNVDDGEEYRKFLTAVLQDGHDDDHALGDNGNDEDEDNDADFEIEIEEALESDIDDCIIEKAKPKETRRRPETRQNRRQKAFSEDKKKLIEQERRPLRPLLPILPTTLIHSISSSLMTETPPNLPPSGNNLTLNGFTPHQIGQLYCLIHEHVQLLVQVFSLCVLEPSKRKIATQVQGLLSDMLNKREQALTWRDVPHPSFCFQLPYIHPSVMDEHPKCLPLDKCVQSYENGHHAKENVETFQTVLGSSWLPIVSGPVLSILDVAPLKFVGKYMDDISTAVQEQMRRYVEATSDLNSEKQPLFPLPLYLSVSKSSAATADAGAPASPEFSTVSSSSPNSRPAKKTLAATLVESSKKQSVALVPRRIAELARQFNQLFNPALFPHNPPPLAVANRVFFTDAEDELLAMGLMEYNTDWKAIQQRFLPCKSKHQIFVRQKNRCSSKAPDNPIKEVRKLKTSPLTEEEKARINEGLTAFKLDWTSIWKFIVPYRDPALLGRLWRNALGKQKSYKKVDPTMREKRRIYERNRRRSKTLAAENLQASDKEDEHEHLDVQNENGEECTENNDEAYVHEAFLADWRPYPSSRIPEITQAPNNLGNHDSASEFTGVSNYSQNEGSGTPRPLTAGPNCSTYKSAMNPSTFVCSLRPYRARKHKNTQQLVRLAPSLPPVNLPPTVRVISQAAFQKSLHGSANQTPRRHNQAVNSGSALINLTQKRSTMITPSAQENGTSLDLQMHPLLFQATGNGHLPYYLLNSGTVAPNSFSFFPKTPHQVKIPTFQNSIQPGVPGEETTSKKKSSVSLDFHPLLQRTNNVNNNPKSGCRSTRFSSDLQPSRDMILCFGAANESNLEINLNSAPRNESNSVVDGAEVLTPSNEGYTRVMDNADDQSLPEIVMEQEELSDSEEEIEDVEFEHEEMTDSEGEDEEPYPYQILNTPNKQQPDAHTDNLSESSAGGNAKSFGCRSKTPFEVGLSAPELDIVRSPWLSLSSQASAPNPDAYASSKNLNPCRHNTGG